MSNGRQGAKLSSAFVPGHEPVDVFFDEPSRTRQEFADECDINVLMRQYEATGVVSHVNQRQPMYLDVGDGVPDLREAIDVVRAAETAFMSLPATVRASFDNDAVKFVEFATDPENSDKLVEWGLASRPVVPGPQEVKVVEMPAPAGESS